MSETKKKQFIRVWTELDMEEVNKHLVIADESLGSCNVCREVGFKIETTKKCPQCQTEFKYVTNRPSGFHKQADPKILARIRSKRPDLILLDWADLDHGRGKVAAREFLKL